MVLEGRDISHVVYRKKNISQRFRMSQHLSVAYLSSVVFFNQPRFRRKLQVVSWLSLSL